MELWTVEGVAHSILFYLDLSTFDAVLHFIQATSELREYLKDDVLWTELSKVHFGGQRGQELAEFLQSLDDRTRFDEMVTVVEGDIQHFDNINGQPLDGIVFPTNPHLSNHYVSAAAAVFQRASHGLEEFVSDPSFRGARPVGSAVVTPAFDAGVDKLIHCVGPSSIMPNYYELLGLTYENVMNAALRENLQCVVMASVSTGSLGVLPTIGGQVAMRTIQKFLVRSEWRGKLAIVCKEECILRTFSYGKAGVLKNFNVIPLLPDNDIRERWMR